MTSIPARLALSVLVCAVLSGPAGSAETPPPEQKPAAAAASSAITPEETDQAKQIFAAQCGWCHGSYGMTADKGPKLAGTAMTEHEVEERIRHGKPGYMPAFHRFLNDQQIAVMAKYIKSLKP